MGLFNDLLKEVLSDQEVKNAINNVASRGISNLGATLFDTDNDGDFDMDDFNNLLTYSNMFVSVIGQAMLSDGEIQDEEVDVAFSIIDATILSDDGYLNSAVLEYGGVSSEQIIEHIKNLLVEPNGLRDIANYALNTNNTDVFYDLACHIVASDGIIVNSEFQFLDELASLLQLPNTDKNRIERKYIKFD